MCGIVGLVLKRSSGVDQTGLVLKQVESLQHRGYQGAGIASFDENGKISFRKSTGDVNCLRSELGDFKACNIAIAHNRWQTHGIESMINSHPHLSNDKTVAVVHNGELYNKSAIKLFLESNGFKFVSDTDTECIPNLIQYYYQETENIEIAIQKTIEQLDGGNAMLVITTHKPNTIYSYNNCQTLSLVDTENYYLIVSDDSAIPAGSHIQYDIGDDDLVAVEPSQFRFLRNAKCRVGDNISVDLTDVDKVGYKYFMEKEILEQPQTLTKAIANRINVDKGEVWLGVERQLARKINEYEKIMLVGIGTSYNACLVGKMYFEGLAGIPTEVFLGSEYFNAPRIKQPDKTLAILVSQSGKTIELIDVAKSLKSENIEMISVVNVVKSPLAKMTGAGVFLKAGPEKAVASTKAYTAQLIALQLLALLFASKRVSRFDIRRYLGELSTVPGLVSKTIDMTRDSIKEVANELMPIEHLFYLGNGINYPVTFEAALKMQEIAYVNARGYSSKELAHGSRALLSSRVPCVLFINSVDETSDQLLAVVEKCHSANSTCILFMDEYVEKKTKFSFPVKKIILPFASSYYNTPFINVVAAQLLAYQTAVTKGNDPDYPRNLCKVVTTR